MNSLGGLTGKYLAGKRVFVDCDDYEAAIGHFESTWQQKVVRFFEEWTPHQVDGVTTHTDFNRQRLLSSGVPADKIFYVSNGVDRERFGLPDPAAIGDLRDRLGLQDRQVIIYVGSLSSPSHPVDLLFQAFARVHLAIPGAVLLLVGGGDEFPRLQSLAAEMGLAEAITFAGRVSPAEVVNYYHLAQVSVDPVHDDGAALGRSPLKLFESWACSVPFVTANVGERPRLMGDPPAGLLCAPGDVDSLAQNLEQILADAALQERLRHLGQERIQNYYWDVLVKDMEAAYLGKAG
jgi:glycosyltransferase involved in cell wall biosynthesis